MRFTLIVLTACASLLFVSQSAAADQGVGLAYTDAVAVFFEMDTPVPVRQNALVRFDKPVRVGNKILMGRYIIEHDTDRMGRGEPCTHIYEYTTKKLAAAFHCTHLTRPRTGKTATVSIQSKQDLPAVMTEFQFAGETDAHGVPGIR